MRLMSLTQTKTLCLTQNESWQLLVSLHVMMYACVLLQFHFIFACKLSCQLLESFHTHAHEKSKYPKLCFFCSILGNFFTFFDQFWENLTKQGYIHGDPFIRTFTKVQSGVYEWGSVYPTGYTPVWPQNEYFWDFLIFQNFPQLIQHFFWKMPKKSDFGLGF